MVVLSLWIAGTGTAEQMEWGQPVVPEPDCKVVFNETRLTITIPAGIRTLLSVQQIANVPRVVQSVSGDFDVQVRVTADWQAAPLVMPAAPFKEAAGQWYISGGLLVLGSDDHYVHHSRNRFFNGNERASVPPVYDRRDKRWIEPRHFEDGRPFEGPSTWLRLERRGQRITTWISHSGRRWFQTRSFETTLPGTVQVGIFAANASDSDFSVNFDEFRLRAGKVPNAKE